MGDRLIMTIHFDQFQRYQTAAEFVNILKKNCGVNNLSILEIGANEHKNLEKFCPFDEIKYLDIVVPDHLLTDPQYIVGDATDLNEIDDNSYDLVIALDVFEHIPPCKRKLFISELERVSKFGVFFGAPFSTASVNLVEYRGNCYYKMLKKTEHRWLIEHIDNTLPVLEDTLEFILQMNKKYFVFEHGSLEMWEKLNYYLWKIEGTNCESETVVNDYYSNQLYRYDISEDNYRKFIFVTDNYFMCKKIEKELKKKFIKNDVILQKKINDLNTIIDTFNDIFLYREMETIKNNNSHVIKGVEDVKAQQSLLLSEAKGLGIKKYKDSVSKIRKLYFDYGNGFNESDTMIFFENELGEVEIDLPLEKEIYQIRIDLAESQLLVLVKKIIYCFEDYELEIKADQLITNSVHTQDNLYCFLTEDPYIIVKQDNLKGLVKIKLWYQIISEGF